MTMIKKSISVTERQNDWIKSQIATGHFGNESEVLRELIRERQIRKEENAVKIEALRAALIAGEESGISDLTLDQIWSKVRSQSKPGNA